MIRVATVEDAKAIAQVHVASWQTTYVNQLPQTVLDTLSVEKRSEGWTEVLSETNGSVLVYEENGAILGFVHYDRSRDSDAEKTTAELFSIYILEGHKGRGIGTQLWNQAKVTMRGAGFTEVTLWVLRTNVKALSFYKKMGFVPDGDEKVLSLNDFETSEIRYRKSLS